MSRVKWEYYTG